MMNIVLLISSLIILIVFIVGQIIKYKRFTHINAMKSIYDEMEMHFVTNKIILKKDYIELLKVFKNLSVNPDFLDIQMLALSKIAADKSGKLKDDRDWFDKTLNSLDNKFHELFLRFDYNSNKVIDLSFWKPDFVFFAIRMLIMYFFLSRAKSLAKLKFEYNFIKNNEGAISYSGMKMANC
ncbi:hypothetical protein [Maribacter cobaltidurans]|uniref:Uncharacterized protein n=1 Tax=Maribacter cobaltidurans TaxID=1178778 RepID=A0A223V336_9FLAO|nr:hypothetical protein [Maribacter cobaltidurans]ASV29843.1 hypothetical protein CJ263_06205 [Maribacter cobaltidurans]GGD92034.1 hypothetical protein GCM10011412_32510 [Maribacter cobaltidurans]